MFTIEQINTIHDHLGKARTFLQYVQALHKLGVTCYDSFLSDGHSEYFGANGYSVHTPAIHQRLTIAANGDKVSLSKHLDLHAKGKTTYLELSKGLADSGVQKWTVDTAKHTMTFYDAAGSALLTETIE